MHFNSKDLAREQVISIELPTQLCIETETRDSNAMLYMISTVHINEQIHRLEFYT